MTLMTEHHTEIQQSYDATITAGSLMPAEGRAVALLMLRGLHLDKTAWRNAVIVENTLQKRSPRSATRQAGLLKQRLLAFDQAGWELVANGSRDTSRQLLLAAALIHSRLLADFFTEVIKPKHQRFDTHLTPADWSGYFALCIQRQADLETLADSTKLKLREIACRVLAEAGYIPSTRKPQIAPIGLTKQTISYLAGGTQHWVLNVMDLAHEH